MHATQLDAGEKLETLDSTTLRLTDYPQVHDRAQLGPLGSLRLTQQAPYRVARGSQAWIRCPSCAPLVPARGGSTTGRACKNGPECSQLLSMSLDVGRRRLQFRNKSLAFSGLTDVMMDPWRCSCRERRIILARMLRGKRYAGLDSFF